MLPFSCPELSGSRALVFEDNQGAMALTENPLSSALIKHKDVRFQFVAKLFRAKKVDIQFVVSEEQHTDMWT